MGLRGNLYIGSEVSRYLKSIQIERLNEGMQLMGKTQDKDINEDKDILEQVRIILGK